MVSRQVGCKVRMTVSMVVVAVLWAAVAFAGVVQVPLAKVADVSNEETHSVTVGIFTVNVPIAWRIFTATESDVFQRQFMSQSDEVIRQYSGAKNPVKSVDIAAFHITGDEGVFVIASLDIPPQSNIVNLLKSQAKDKMQWGIRQGYIKKDLGVVPLDCEQLSGFYIVALGHNGEVQISGGIQHKEMQDKLLQLTLLCPKRWDAVQATDTLTSILKTIVLRK